MPALRTPAWRTRVRPQRTFLTALSALGLAAGLLGSFACSPAPRTTTVETGALLQAGPGLELRPREPQGQRQRVVVRQPRRRPVRPHGIERRPEGTRPGRSQGARRRHPLLVGQPGQGEYRPVLLRRRGLPPTSAPARSALPGRRRAFRAGLLLYQRNGRQPLLPPPLRHGAQDHGRGNGPAAPALL
jgi:hypothetical protein